MATDLSWYQESLLTHEVLEARLRIGLIPAENHAQLQWEIFDPRTRVVVGMSSKPHVRMPTWPQMALGLFDDLVIATESLLGPFDR